MSEKRTVKGRRLNFPKKAEPVTLRREEASTLHCQKHLGAGILAHEEEDPRWVVVQVRSMPPSTYRVMDECILDGCGTDPCFKVIWARGGR